MLGRGGLIAQQHFALSGLDGDYMRGVFVDRTSDPQAFTIYAFTQAWFSVADSFHLGFSFGLKRGISFSGSVSAIVAEVGEIIQSDKGLRRVVWSNAQDPLYLDTRVAMSGIPPQPIAARAEAAAMRALGGDHAWALFTLRLLKEEMASFDRPIDQWRKKMVSDLVVSLSERGCVRDVLDPMADAGRNRLTIKHVGERPITPPV